MTFTHALSTNNYGPAKFVVSSSAANGTHTTIAAALTAASSGDTILIRPGTYTEDITLKAGVNLAGYSGDGLTPNVIILGNTTASYTGTVTLAGIQLKTNGASCLTLSGANATSIILNGCNIDGNNATAISANAASGVIRLYNSVCQTESNNLLFAVTTIGGIAFQTCRIVCGSGANTIAAGAVNFFNCNAQVFSITTSSTGSFNCYNSFFDNSVNQTIFTTAGTGSGVIMNCELFSGSSSAISIGSGTSVSITNSTVTSSNTNAITGAGTLSSGNITFGGTSSTVNPTTRTALITSPRAESWTPVMLFGGSATGFVYTTQIGYYSRIGNVVFIQADIMLSTKGSGTGAVTISGLPVTSGAIATTGQSVIPFGQINNLTLTAGHVGGVSIDTAATTMTLIDYNPTSGSAQGTTTANATFTNTTLIRFQGHYFAA